MSEGLKEVLEPALGPRVSKPQIDRLIKKFSKPDLGLAVYDRVASLIAATPDVAKQLENPPPEATWALTSGAVQTGFRKLGGTTRYVYADPILREDRPAGALVIFLDASDLETAEWELWRFNAIRFLVLAVALALIALLVVRMSLTQPLAKMARWTKAVRRGHVIEPPELPDESLFGPIAREVTVLAKNLQRARAAAEEEAALRLIGQTLWTEERLKQFAKMRLGERPLVVVSNREPVSHVWKDGQIQVVTPGERPGHRDGSGDAGLRRRVGGAGQRRRRPRDRGRPRAAARAAGRPPVHPASGCGSPPRRRRATTTASRTRACGRSATSCTTARSSAPRTGRSTARSTRSSPPRSSRRSRAPSRRWS